MTYQVHYESKPGMWERYTGVKEVEADGADGGHRQGIQAYPERFSRPPTVGMDFYRKLTT